MSADRIHFKLLDDIEELVNQLEAVCLDPKSDQARTQEARIRRIQLLDVDAVLRGRKFGLDLITHS